MVSGSSVANTVGSGSVTIPLMKKTGYKPEFAAAAEAAASTGGQIMPPIMGAAAFLMAEMVGVPYSDIIKRAVLPAILYFTGIFLQVHLRAKRLDLKGIPREDLPKAKDLLPLTGYVHGGCSPIGMKKPFRTVIDETALLYDTIMFSAGKIGYQVQLSVEDLKKVIPFSLDDICDIINK